MNYIKQNNLKIDQILFEFINNEVIPGTDIKSDDFWNKFEKVVHELSPINKSLIQKREEIQKKIAQKLGYKLVDHKLELYGSKIKKNKKLAKKLFYQNLWMPDE